MRLFDNEEYDRFFNPLCCKNKRIYYECMLQLIEKSKFIPVLYETDAKDCIILYLRNCTYAFQEDNSYSIEEIINNDKSESENASAILRYYRHCGWISERELGRNGDNIATVTPYCRKMIDAIERIFNRDTSGALTNHIFSIYDILKSAFEDDNGRTIRPYSNILVPLADNVSNLKNELLILKDSIRSIMKIVIKMTELNSFGQFLVKDEMMKLFFDDYFFIKKDGLIPGYILEIEKYLRKLVNTDVYANIIKEYKTLKQVDEFKAKETVEGLISAVNGFISYDYVKEIDYIDKKINSYYNLYTTRILMVLSNNTNMQSYINRLLMVIKDLDADERNEVLSSVSASLKLQSYNYVGRKSIERRKKRQPNVKRSAIITSNLTDEEKLRLTKELMQDNKDRYSVQSAEKYFTDLIKDEESIDIKESMISSKEDALMMAAGIIYSGSNEFNYEIELLEGILETKSVNISNMRIKRKSYE